MLSICTYRAADSCQSFFLQQFQISISKDCCFTNFLCFCRIIEENNGKAPLTYNRMQAIVKSLGPPKKPIPAPTLEDMKGTAIL